MSIEGMIETPSDHALEVVIVMADRLSSNRLAAQNELVAAKERVASLEREYTRIEQVCVHMADRLSMAWPHYPWRTRFGFPARDEC